MKSLHALAALALATGITATAQAAEPIFESLATLHVVPAQLASFTAALRDNAAHARTEPGNLSFSLLQSQTDPDTLYVLEQWKDKAAYDAHLKQPKLVAMHELAKTALLGSIDHTTLHPIAPGSDPQPAHIDHSPTTSNVLLFLTLKPGALDSVRSTIAQVSPTFRAAPGNQVFDVYQDQEHPEQLVQVERWTDEAQHQENLKRPVIQLIRAGYKDTLAKPMMSGRVPVNDITEG
ncbi:putative quinol monooxygenase [Pseudomonas sp. TE3610]